MERRLYFSRDKTTGDKPVNMQPVVLISIQTTNNKETFLRNLIKILSKCLIYIYV